MPSSASPAPTARTLNNIHTQRALSNLLSTILHTQRVLSTIYCTHTYREHSQQNYIHSEHSQLFPHTENTANYLRIQRALSTICAYREHCQLFAHTESIVNYLRIQRTLSTICAYREHCQLDSHTASVDNNIYITCKNIQATREQFLKTSLSIKFSKYNILFSIPLL